MPKVLGQTLSEPRRPPIQLKATLFYIDSDYSWCETCATDQSFLPATPCIDPPIFDFRIIPSPRDNDDARALAPLEETGADIYYTY